MWPDRGSNQWPLDLQSDSLPAHHDLTKHGACMCIHDPPPPHTHTPGKKTYFSKNWQETARTAGWRKMVWCSFLFLCPNLRVDTNGAKKTSMVRFFLAHLSRRLTRWAYSIPMVRRRPHFQTWISLKSKQISNDQELKQSDTTSCPQNQKGNN